MPENQAHLEQESKGDFQTKIESIAKSDQIVDIEKILSIREELLKAGKQVNNEQIANMVFCSKRSLLNALMADRWKAVEVFTNNRRQLTPSEREVIYAGKGTNGVMLTPLDSSASDKGVAQNGSNPIEYELHLKDKWVITSEDLRFTDFNDDLLNRMLDCIVEGFSEFEDELLIYNILGQKKSIEDPRGLALAKPVYMENMPPAKSILPPAYSSYITHTSNDKGYEMRRTSLQRLQELRLDSAEFTTDNKNIFTAIDKALEYADRNKIKRIHLNVKSDLGERTHGWRAICLIPYPLFLKIQKEGYGTSPNLQKSKVEFIEIKIPSPFGDINDGGFIYKDILFIRTNLYISWKDEDPVALCEKDGSTKWYKKGASGGGFSEDDPAKLTGTIPGGKEMYRLALIGADAIHYIYRYLETPSIPDFINDTSPGIDKDVLPTDFTFIKFLWNFSWFRKSLLVNSYQYTSMQRIRKKTDNGSQEPPTDAGIFTIDLIA